MKVYPEWERTFFFVKYDAYMNKLKKTTQIN